jgi:hypothetical protein
MGALGGGAALGVLEEIHRYLLRHPETMVPLFNDLFTASFLPASSSWLLVILGFAAGALGGLLSLRRISI